VDGVLPRLQACGQKTSAEDRFLRAVQRWAFEAGAKYLLARGYR
jgi:hypothetical protein